VLVEDHGHGEARPAAVLELEGVEHVGHLALRRGGAVRGERRGLGRRPVLLGHALGADVLVDGGEVPQREAAREAANRDEHFWGRRREDTSILTKKSIQIGGGIYLNGRVYVYQWQRILRTAVNGRVYVYQWQRKLRTAVHGNGAPGL